ncbi:MAG: MoxR family ATPase [Ignavibacteria bacterium]|nr:MoxR family ATPase [Ignavibacteria bacterium]
MKDTEIVKELNKKYGALRKEIGKIIVGQERIIEQLMISILSRGHCLLVGVPGLAKTLIVKSLSEALDLKFSRIQFTPDLMPSDITGTEILESGKDIASKFRFIQGPVFANIILADEINRTPPKTQSALLEAMQEHKVTAAGITYKLEEPFFVLATQNPIEQEGTYPLPEAQLDRFMFNLWLDYPSSEEEMEIIRKTTTSYEYKIETAISGNEIIEFQELLKKVPVADELVKFTVDLVAKTRPMNENSPKFIKDYLNWGAGPRATQYLILAAKAFCIIDGRYSPEIDDIKRAAEPVLRHRLIMNFNAEADNISVLEIIKRIIE